MPHDDNRHPRAVGRLGQLTLLHVGVRVHPDDRFDVTQHPRTRRQVDVVVAGRGDEGLLDDGGRVGVESFVAPEAHQTPGNARPDLERLTVVGPHHHHADSMLPGGEDNRGCEGIHPVNAHRRIFGDDLAPPPGCVDGCHGDAELDGIEVGDDEQPVAAGTGRMFNAVLDPRLARPHDHRGGGWVGGRQQVDLGGGAGCRRDTKPGT